MATSDQYGLPVGDPVPDWERVDLPPDTAVEGRWCRLEPLAEQHVPGLLDAYAADDGRMWTYMPWGPFDSVAGLRKVVDWIASQANWIGFAIVSPDGTPLGMASYLRIDPAMGVIEVGAIAYAPALSRTTAATEAMFLMAERAFDHGYRRYEWKCDSLNEASRSAARRLGFTYEGTFRQATIYKGRNRDTAWLSITDKEWPALRDVFLHWLDPGNFDHAGHQRTSLGRVILA